MGYLYLRFILYVYKAPAVYSPFSITVLSLVSFDTLHKKGIFLLKICAANADLVTFTEEILNRKLHFIYHEFIVFIRRYQKSDLNYLKGVILAYHSSFLLVLYNAGITFENFKKKYLTTWNLWKYIRMAYEIVKYKKDCSGDFLFWKLKQISIFINPWRKQYSSNWEI